MRHCTYGDGGGASQTLSLTPALPPRQPQVRNEIQRVKIEMANEVIDAGRFDQQTSMEERRHTLESLLQVCVWGGGRGSSGSGCCWLLPGCGFVASREARCPPQHARLLASHGQPRAPLPCAIGQPAALAHLVSRGLPQDEDRGKRVQNVVPTWSELNRMWARTGAPPGCAGLGLGAAPLRAPLDGLPAGGAAASRLPPRLPRLQRG